MTRTRRSPSSAEQPSARDARSNCGACAAFSARAGSSCGAARRRSRARPGEIVALVGPSGAGKSTLLHVAGLLERPDGGAVLIAGRDCGRLSDEQRTLLRRRALGFVYQFHHLLPEFSALENVMLPQMIAGVARRARGAGRDLLDRVGLAARRPSPGAAFGRRAAAGRDRPGARQRPEVLLGRRADRQSRPHTGEGGDRRLLEIVRANGLAALIATHNLDLARRLDRIVAFEDGRLRPA